MAAEDLSSLSDALSQTFAPVLERQWNRSAVLASRVPARAGGGKNASWDVEFSGATAVTVADGADVDSSEFNSDKNTSATLPWAHYRTSFQVSETEVDAAASSMGIPQVLEDIFGERIIGNGAKLASKINSDLYAGDGTGGGGEPTLYGLTGSTALDASGSYAGILRGTYAEWDSNVLSNGSVARPLTLDLLEQMDQAIFTASGEDYDELLVSPGIFRKYKNLFQAIQRVTTDGSASPRYDASTDTLFFRGKPVTRDKDCPTGTVIFKNNSAVEVKWLPRVLNAYDANIARMSSLAGGNGKQLTVTGLPCRITVLGKTGDNIKVSMKIVLQQLVKRPNAMGVIKDVSES